MGQKLLDSMEDAFQDLPAEGCPTRAPPYSARRCPTHTCSRELAPHQPGDGIRDRVQARVACTHARHDEGSDALDFMPSDP